MKRPTPRSTAADRNAFHQSTQGRTSVAPVVTIDDNGHDTTLVCHDDNHNDSSRYKVLSAYDEDSFVNGLLQCKRACEMYCGRTCLSKMNETQIHSHALLLNTGVRYQNLSTCPAFAISSVIYHVYTLAHGCAAAPKHCKA